MALFSKPATYTTGPRYLVSQNVTKQTFIKIIDEINAAFGEGYEFDLEPITEGGIIWRQWPGKLPGHFKTFRLCIRDWPDIAPSWKIIWQNNTEVVLKSGEIHFTTLKAFYGAPAWTMEEVEKFRSVLAKHGLEIQPDDGLEERLSWYS